MTSPATFWSAQAERTAARQSAARIAAAHGRRSNAAGADTRSPLCCMNLSDPDRGRLVVAAAATAVVPAVAARAAYPIGQGRIGRRLIGRRLAGRGDDVRQLRELG